MTSIKYDHLDEFFKDEPLHHRHVLWLWIFLNNYYEDFSRTGQSINTKRDQIASFLALQPRVHEHILLAKHKELLPEKQLTWISEGKRQIEWLSKKLRHHTTSSRFASHMPNLSGKDLLIATIDTWEVGTTEKTLVLNSLEAEWLEHKKGDNVFKWFKDSPPKCALAWTYLESATRKHHYSPVTNYEDLMIFFDNARMEPFEVIFHIGKIKKKWSQQKYRQSLTGKAQYNFILSDEAISHLDKVADTHNLSRAQVLELLIRIESERNLCTPEISKRKQFIDSL